jgi:branched-chain amino acid transport system substrate-binding protein
MTPRQTQASVPATPGVTKNQILIGTSLPQSGIAAPYAILANAEQAYFDYVNAHGGIYGRKLKLLALDDGYDPARTLSNVRDLVLHRNVFALLGVLGTDNTLAALPFVTQQKVPLIFPLTGSSKVIYPLRKNVFTYEPSYTVEGKVLADYAIKTLHAKSIAVFYQDDDFGKEGLAAVTSEIQKLGGAQMVGSASYELTDLDMSTQVQNLQQQNPDAVITFALPQSLALYLTAAAKAGFHTQVLSTSIALVPKLLKALGPLAEQTYFDAWLPDPSSNLKQIVFYRSVISKYANTKTAPVGPVTLVGVTAAQILVQALRQAGPNLSRDGLIKALEKIHNWSGSPALNLTFGSGKHNGPEGAYMAEWANGGLKQVSNYTFP